MSADRLISEWFEDNCPRLTGLSDKIWEYAELAFEEYQSSKALMDVFRAEGFKVEEGVAGIPTAFVATWGAEGPVIGFIGEFDAVPGVSQTLSTRKEALIPGGAGHGCGHNLLGVGSLGACLAVKKAIQELGIKGTVKFFGCPAEEGGAAKVFMVRAGVFKGVDVVLRWHPSFANWVSMARSLAMNSLKFTFHGRAAHAAINPHLGRSAIDAAILMDIGVNYLREHVMSDVRIHSVITKGGDAPNVVPPLAQIWYYVRAPHRSDVDEVSDRLKTIAKGAAMMTETTVDIEFVNGSCETLPNQSLSEIAYRNFLKVGGPKYSQEEEQWAAELTKGVTKSDKVAALRASGLDPALAEYDLHHGVCPIFDIGRILPISTDSADVSWNVPTLVLYTCCSPIGAPNHSWQQVVGSGMGIGHKGMVTAGKVIALTALDVLMDPDALAKVRSEFDQATSSWSYKSPLPDDARPRVKKPAESSMEPDTDPQRSGM